MNRIRSILAFLCLLAFAANLAAQQYIFRAYRQADGLGNLSINGLTTDRNGFLWLATENGVYEFLGAGFRRYGLEDGIAGVDIRDIVADPQGTVWVGTEEDLFRWDGTRFLRAGSTPIPIVGAHRIATEDEHHLLIVDRGRLYRLEHDAQGRMLSYVPAIPRTLVSLHPDLESIASISVLRNAFREAYVWIGSGNQLLSLAKDGNSSRADLHLMAQWSKDKGLPADQWQNVVLDRKGTLWAAGLKHVAVLLPGAEHFIERNIPGAEHHGVFGHAPLVEDPQGKMLVPAGAGIARWNGKAWQFIGRANGLTRFSACLGIAFDRSGDLFLAGRGDGLYSWSGYSDWEGWNSEQSLPSRSIWAIVPGGQDHVFLGTDNGPAWIDMANGDSGTLRLNEKWRYGRIAAMGSNSDGTLWAGTHDGIFFRIHTKSNRSEQLAHLPAHILVGFQDSSRRVFLFTSQGVYLRTSTDPTAVPQRVPDADLVLGESSLIQSVQSSCEAPDHAVWMVGNNRIVRFKNGNWTSPPISGLSKLNGTLLGLSCAQDGSIWATGDQTGTWHLAPENEGLRASQLQVPDEWRSLSCLTVLQDRRGWLWLGTELGFLVWNGHEWRHLFEETGLIWDDTNQGVLRESADGSLWIGTTGGVAHLLRPEHIFDAFPMSVTLTQLQRGSENLSQLQKVVIDENGPPLQVQISSPAVRNRSELRLRLRMVGSTPDWMDSKLGSAAFTRLRPGSYTFMGMACNPGVNACSPPIAIGVEVLPAWWNSRWFYALCVLAVAFLVIAGVRLYARRLRQRSQELEQLVHERTKELEKSRELLRVQATHDGLTGMLNRVAVMDALTDEIERARRGAKSFVLALVDLDLFKRVNDSRGHLAGDQALREFAAAISKAIRPYDHSGRYGGEEFLIVLPDLPPDAAEERLSRFHESVSNLSVGWDDCEFRITCSVGAVIVPPPTAPTSPESLLAIADEALYEAKASGRNRVIIKRFERIDSLELAGLLSAQGSRS